MFILFKKFCVYLSKMEDTDNENQFLIKTLKEYIILEEEMQKLRKALKERNEKKTLLAETLICYIKEKDISINLDGKYQGKEIKYEMVERLGCINEKNMDKTIREFIDNPEIANNLLSKINETRKKTTNEKLKIFKPKQNMNMKIGSSDISRRLEED